MIPDVDMDFESPKIQRIDLEPDEGNIPNGRHIPNGVVLIHSDSYVRIKKKFQLPTEIMDGVVKYRPLPVTENLERLIELTVQDCVLRQKTSFRILCSF
jgi:hypothetical protein